MWPGLVAVPVVVRSGCRNVRSTVGVGSDHGSAFGRRAMAGAQPADGRVRAGRAGGARGRSGIAGMDPGRYRVLLSVIHIRIIKRTDLSVLLSVTDLSVTHTVVDRAPSPNTDHRIFNTFSFTKCAIIYYMRHLQLATCDARHSSSSSASAAAISRPPIYESVPPRSP